MCVAEGAEGAEGADLRAERVRLLEAIELEAGGTAARRVERAVKAGVEARKELKLAEEAASGSSS